CKWQSYFHDFLSAIYDSIQEHLKRSNQLLSVAIDIQMLSIGRSHDDNIRMQGQERAITFIDLHHHYIIFSKKHIVLIVCTDSAQECRAIKTRMFQNMCYHGRSCCLSMRTCNGDSKSARRDKT